jgi:hypothetical protein
MDWRSPAAHDSFDLEFLAPANGKPRRSKKPT